MSWQQSPNGNWNPNGSSEDSLRAARLNAQRNGALGQQLTLNEQLALQNLGLAGGPGAGNPGFQNLAAQGAAQQGLFSHPQFAQQAALGGGLQGQGLHFGGSAAGNYPKPNALQGQYGMGLNNFAGNPQNSAMLALFQQQLLNLQQNGSFQNTGQASHINNNLAQALALAQQQAPAANMKLAASLAGNQPNLNAYLYRLQQQAMAQNMRQLNMNQLNATQLLQQQALQQQANQLQAVQQRQMSANMATLLKTGNSGGLGEGHMLGSGLGGGSALANQGMNLAGFSSTGLANSPLASAPLLPILGTDLAKPSQKSIGGDSLANQCAVSGADTDVMKQMEALSLGSSVTRPGSGINLNDVTGRTQAMSPTGQQRDSARGGLSSPPPPPGVQTNMGQNQAVASVTSPSAGSKDRDLTTLKTLGQMLAKTGNTVENAVQNGLLGGCNAEDVKIVWEAYVMEVASLKQYDTANKAFQKQGAELVAKRAKSDDPEATKLLLEAAKAPPASVPANLREALQCLGMDAFSTPPNPTMHPSSATEHGRTTTEKTEEVIENDSGWDGVIENEHDYVPHHIIDEVNTPKDHPTNVEIPKEEAFNAINYGFFAAGGTEDPLADCVLEEGDEEEAADAPIAEETTRDVSENTNHSEISRERTKSEENNNTAEDDLPEVGSAVPPMGLVTKNEMEKPEHCDERGAMKEEGGTEVGPPTEPASASLA